ncbi:hypothetical protein AVEN_154967-1 [Araneus ventricosus]|uniref:Uncharacterized protein n=1 Tax=Araneus ventricosus TaxID=182803 RepID=A0A4Y2A750_ARAVE|nr:hypothetical protein AVEN_154967-1 [Araneus ventricosus]
MRLFRYPFKKKPRHDNSDNSEPTTRALYCAAFLTQNGLVLHHERSDGLPLKFDYIKNMIEHSLMVKVLSGGYLKDRPESEEVENDLSSSRFPES